MRYMPVGGLDPKQPEMGHINKMIGEANGCLAMLLTQTQALLSTSHQSTTNLHSRRETSDGVLCSSMAPRTYL